jgi:hypothetical protein
LQYDDLHLGLRILWLAIIFFRLLIQPKQIFLV